ncbi:hypothetical protein [Colwellia hornerae]|uniref:Uncharacterized protein n=1 Tax=Colwellia hornerae TaxID=89402 RepID=A0A5C6QRG5_9GAMM|nr:hypothetical protein [Colwellia hornerae]TWX55659.1 hypothetical protein ESZ28_05650 [Colwellia hornerae]TWX61869.1 hypothetical protein ESZ26_04425 [Colwellia hornerae]TWX71201.1 hypothetical protein ESZ27_02005 [Colwellia hornerae]
MNQSELLNKLKGFEHKEVFFGPQGFSVITKMAALNKAQIGYSVDKKGGSLVNNAIGNWQNSWLVIATDTELGDPYFIDLADKHLAVYTAIAEQENQWQATLVSASLVGFEQCLTAIYQQCQQKSALYLPDESCIFDLQILEIFGKQLVEFSQTNDFWQHFFVGYVDWLRDEHV